jgi:type I restriction enzyme S subunit
MEKTLIPSLRFKGFTEAWEQRKLDDMCSNITKQTGFDYSATIKPSLLNENNGRVYSFIQNKDFDGEKINLNTDFYIPVKIAERFPKILLDRPSLLITISGKIGNVGYYKLKRKAFIGGAVGICKLKRGNGSIIVYSLQSVSGQKYFQSLVKASSHSNITVEDIRKIKVFLPKSRSEEQKILQLISRTDNLITLHQRKYDKLVNVKKALLNKMFPKNGELVPKLRFKGFTDTWEQRKLGELGQVVMNRRIFKDQTSDTGDVPFYKIGTFGSNPDAFISRELFEEYKSKFPYPNVGDILISASGSIGRTVGYKGKDEYFQDSNIVWLKHNDKVENIFLKHFYSIVKWSGLEGSTIQRLYNKNILETNIMLPSISEQMKIGNLLDGFDNLITLHQRKYEKLVNIKKALLQKMFV